MTRATRYTHHASRHAHWPPTFTRKRPKRRRGAKSDCALIECLARSDEGKARVGVVWKPWDVCFARICCVAAWACIVTWPSKLAIRPISSERGQGQDFGLPVSCSQNENLRVERAGFKGSGVQGIRGLGDQGFRV